MKNFVKTFAALACATLLAATVAACSNSGSSTGGGTPTEGTAVGATFVEEGDLDAVLGNYTFNGESHDITIRNVIEEFTTVEAVVQEDGSYIVPSAEDVLDYVRNHIILDEAAARGIEATDDDVKAYCIETYGIDDIQTIADSAGVTAEAAEVQLKDAATMDLLRGEVAETDAGAAPAMPETVTDDTDADADTDSEDTAVAEDEALPEYAEYIINLAGDEWDSENDTWASTDGEYYAALSEYEIHNDSATYEAAYMAYNVAYQKWYDQYNQMTGEWTDFANTLFSNALISIYTVAV